MAPRADQCPALEAEMSTTHRITRKPTLFRRDARRAAGAMAALFALAAQPALAQLPGDAPRRDAAPAADSQPARGSDARAPAVRGQSREEGTRRPIGWAVAMVLIGLALRPDAVAESAEGA